MDSDDARTCPTIFGPTLIEAWPINYIQWPLIFQSNDPGHQNTIIKSGTTASGSTGFMFYVQVFIKPEPSVCKPFTAYLFYTKQVLLLNIYSGFLA